jgi:hypothetical protein
VGTAAGPRAPLKCYGCGKPGHLKRDYCETKTSPTKTTPNCAYCKKLGHSIDDCWLRDKSKKQPRFGGQLQTQPPGRVNAMELMEPNQEVWRPEALVFPWGQSM